jgi:predicted HD superfamily hydrolase involved in NAD metabolism
VADEALRLAEQYGADPQKAYIAGLLHDTTKNYSVDEHLKFAEKFDIMFSDVEKASPKLWHAITGSYYVLKLLNINDPEIIDAIRYHTTGKADMCLLENLIYLADFTSADRTYRDVDEMRRLVDISLVDATEYSLDFLVNDLARRGLTVHPDTAAAYEQIKSQKS